MPITVKNLTRQSNDSNNVQYGEGTRIVEVEGIQYVIGPNEFKSFADDSIGLRVDAASTTLRLGDSRDADNSSGQAGRT
jgi:hypothetical protein